MWDLKFMQQQQQQLAKYSNQYFNINFLKFIDFFKQKTTETHLIAKLFQQSFIQNTNQDMPSLVRFVQVFFICTQPSNVVAKACVCKRVAFVFLLQNLQSLKLTGLNGMPVFHPKGGTLAPPVLTFIVTIILKIAFIFQVVFRLVSRYPTTFLPRLCKRQ
eukprot:TRINITY_DN5523_c2_g1_i1.p4 TRINITY_DN5523_c2_g1~~TRINITY_DN5523_c2_g1_i1.p4  ORF type:complete len:160 (-),score=4.54 TRINITY_DN5523_c2_g1_i1:1238-1717(-)